MAATKPVILILTTHTGGGHRNLAQSLTEIIGPDFEYRIVNPQAEMSERWYSFISRHWVHFLSWQYYFTDNVWIAWCFHRVLALGLSPRLSRIIEDVRPGLIIVTHALLSYSVGCALKRSDKKIPLVFQLTDLEQVHATWFTEKHVSAYLVPSEEIFAQALKRGVERKCLYLTGRPVRHQFAELPSQGREEVFATLGFDPNVYTIFLQGGAMGSARVHRMLESLLASDLPVQIMLAAGNNSSLAASYTGRPQVHVLSFMERIAPYMAASDIIVGKAGASFITEAFMLEKPFLATAFIPGQESPNLHFIQQHQLGWVRLRPAGQQALIVSLIQGPALIAGKMSAIRTYKAWNQQANQAIRPLIEQLLLQQADG